MRKCDTIINLIHIYPAIKTNQLIVYFFLAALWVRDSASVVRSVRMRRQQLRVESEMKKWYYKSWAVARSCTKQNTLANEPQVERKKQLKITNTTSSNNNNNTVSIKLLFLAWSASSCSRILLLPLRCGSLHRASCISFRFNWPDCMCSRIQTDSCNDNNNNKCE